MIRLLIPPDFEEVGRSVAASEDALLIGSRGGAYAFHRVDGAWSIFPSRLEGPPQDLAFGRAVAIDNGTAVVAGGGGVAHVFEYVGIGRWRRAASLACPRMPAACASFGDSVAIHGRTAAVALPGVAVYVFEKVADQWRLRDTLPAADIVSLSATATVTASVDGAAVHRGARYPLYTRASAFDGGIVFGNGSAAGVLRDGEVAPLFAEEDRPGFFFGDAVAGRGGVILVGAPRDSLRGYAVGAVYVFPSRRRVDAPVGGVSGFGSAVAVSGDGYFVVGAASGGAFRGRVSQEEEGAAAVRAAERDDNGRVLYGSIALAVIVALMLCLLGRRCPRKRQ